MTQLKSKYDHLYISPHFDDVALSCGGSIFRHTAIGDSVLVVTVTAAEPPDDFHSDTVESLHRRWADSLGGAPLPAMVARRRAEDRAAFSRLRADVLHLPFLDCIYRAGPAGDPLYPGPVDMFSAFNPADEAIIDAVAGAFGELPAAEQIYAPLGVGNHIDHRVARRAAERVFDALAYYEDYPYTMAAGALDAVLPPESRGGWSAETNWLTETALKTKIEAVAAYHSQLSSFFTGRDDLVNKLREEGQRVLAQTEAGGQTAPNWAVGGERLWRKRPL
jgi:LmbE family N-acetylglucosaminyl deacetylase